MQSNRIILHKTLYSYCCLSNTFAKQGINAVCGGERNGTTRTTQPSHLTDAAESVTEQSLHFSRTYTHLSASVLPLIVCRAWMWLWASNLENQGIQRKAQSVPPGLRWLPSPAVNGSDFFQTCSSPLTPMKALLATKAVPFSARSFWSIPCVSLLISSHGSVPIITHVKRAPWTNYGPTSHWPCVKSKPGRVHVLERICPLASRPP